MSANLAPATVTLELVTGALQSARAEMEALIDRTAMSPFIRAKKDYFTAFLDRDGRLAAALSARVDQLRNEARVAERLREEIAAERRNVLSVVTRKQEAPPFVRILDDLTRLIPDSAWVSRLDFRDGTIRAVMNAPESGSIVRLIEGSDRFSDARMVTAVRQIPVTGHEQFTLSFSAIKEAKR